MAFSLWRLAQVICTAIDIIATGIKGIDRTAMQAGFGITADTGRLSRGLRPIYLEISAQQRETVRMPKSVVGMDHNAYR
jgi:hypothetical protein